MLPTTLVKYKFKINFFWKDIATQHSGAKRIAALISIKLQIVPYSFAVLKTSVSISKLYIVLEAVTYNAGLLFVNRGLQQLIFGRLYFGLIIKII